MSGLALTLVSLLVGGQAKAASFNFTRIADTTNNPFVPSTQYSSVERGLGTPGFWRNSYNLETDPNYQAGKGIAISNGGRIAYHAEKRTSSGQTYQGIYIGLGAAPETVATTDGTIFASFDQGIAINANKETAFIATLNDGTTAIYVNRPGWPQPRLIASSTEGYDFAPGVSINDSGEVAFTARRNGHTNVYKATLPTAPNPPSVTTEITQCSGLSADGSQCPVDFYAPSINNEGVVSFSSENGIFVGDGGATTPVVSDNPAFLVGSYREANINDNGLVSGYVGITANTTPIPGLQGQIIFSGDGANGSVIAGNYFENPWRWGHGDPTSSSFFSMGTSSINDNGNVAFMANQSNPQDSRNKKGIFTGSHAIDDKVIGLGDTLLGSTVVDLAMDRGSLSNDSEIAFWARLANGTEGVYRANPFGDSQFNPWLPNCPHQEINTMSFCGVTSGAWYDPPTAYGFHYEMDSDSLFTSILDLPSTFENPFTVLVEDIVLGEFSSGDEIDFSLYADILGDFLIDGEGVERFTVRTGDAIDPTNPMALPIKLAFNTETADFTLSPVELESTPEPATVLGLLSVSALFLGSRLKRK
ncbi:MAG: PEP-CTERM sorting domain-containing protein [Okeania sp. SIO3B5]|nr:PEP-CTERM sorting domain-containing protein [Okeania sp. SIO3B5]